MGEEVAVLLATGVSEDDFRSQCRFVKTGTSANAQ
jgi:hypothetical protein